MNDVWLIPSVKWLRELTDNPNTQFTYSAWSAWMSKKLYFVLYHETSKNCSTWNGDCNCMVDP